MPLIPDESNSNTATNSPAPSLHNTLSSPSERLASRSTPASAVHSREPSAVRGRTPDHSTLNPSSLQPQNNRRGHSHSKNPEAAGSRPGVGYDAGLERQSSNSSYGHHRQTSIVHGIQHSRNPSFATSSASNSPLSPELIASLGRSGGTGTGTGNGPGAQEQESPVFGRLEQPEMLPYQSPGGNGSSTLEDMGAGSPAYHRRMNSNGRTWQDRSHSRSHSRHHHTELKTVGEYALHHLFNSVRPSPGE